MNWRTFLRFFRGSTTSGTIRTRRRHCLPRLELLEDRLAPATFTVVNTNDAGAGSFRQALISSNTAVGADTVNFNIPGAGVKTISLLSPLPALTGATTIAGNSQPGFVAAPLIVLNGGSAGRGTNGLDLKGAGSTVQSLVINGFEGNGIRITGSNCIVQGCYIGTSSSGASLSPNDGHGVLITGAATNVRIGGGGPAGFNVISGNRLSGVAILGAFTSSNRILSNFIGTDLNATLALGNRLDGILISGGAKNNTIGSNFASSRNVILDNFEDGIEISGAGTTANRVEVNTIGASLGNHGNGVGIYAGAKSNVVGANQVPDASFLSVAGNDGNGIEISGADTTANLIQHTHIGQRTNNAIVGNGAHGVLIANGAANNFVGPNPTFTGFRNLIVGNAGSGVQIQDAGTTGNVVRANFIGITNGSVVAANALDGVTILNGATKNLIGGTVEGNRNFISGNGDDGVEISGAGTAGNLVHGNFIGTDFAGLAERRNSNNGVRIADGAVKNSVGGAVAGVRNVISGHSGNSAGVRIQDAATTANSVQGNFIGTDLTGTAKIANASGVLIAGASKNLIGGTVPLAHNLISGNDTGIKMLFLGTEFNRVQGNFIGTNVAGNAALGNSTGVTIANAAANNIIGGTVAGAGNVISGNLSEGIKLDDNNAGGLTTDNKIQGNLIGTNSTGDFDLGNGTDGIVIRNRVTNTLIGGTVPGARNVISGNDRFGIRIEMLGTTNNLVQGNFIGLAKNAVTPIGNASHGVIILADAANNTIGGNRIGFNGGDGVLIGHDPALTGNFPAGAGNSVLGNSIFANAGSGIDLGPNDGFNDNDPGDGDSGPNSLLNSPNLTNAYLTGSTLDINGFINTQQNKVLRIEFFANVSGDQGQSFLGFLNLSMGAKNTVVFTKLLTVPASIVVGHRLTATITDELGNTSEFSISLIIE